MSRRASPPQGPLTDHDHSGPGEGGSTLSVSTGAFTTLLTVPSFDNLADAPDDVGSIVHITGNGADPEGLYRRTATAYEEVVDATGGTVTGTLTIDGASGGKIVLPSSFN